MQTRMAAALILRQVIQDGRSLSAVLSTLNEDLVEPRNQALVQELCFGVLRWRWRLDALALLLLRKPLRRKDSDIHCLVLLGFYQLIYTRIPAHAAVAETVAATKGLKKEWAAGVVNAVLRAFQRQQSTLLEQVDGVDSVRHSHPNWLLKQIKMDWPTQWQDIAEENNKKPPMILRVNRLKINRERYLELLAQASIKAQPLALSECHQGIVLEVGVDVNALPGFSEGYVSIQDGAGQCVAPLLDLQQGHRVLDACAAPGSKTGHILELQPDIASLTAVDVDAERVTRLCDNLRRLGLTAQTVIADVTTPQWWDGRLFDRILLDAPCSATGVIRRHPDIKSLRKASDISRLAQDQYSMLERLWQMLTPGGMLLYTTCSIFAQENQDLVTLFLDNYDDASERLINASWGRPVLVGRQLLPGEYAMDGFYFACIDKH